MSLTDQQRIDVLGEAIIRNFTAIETLARAIQADIDKMPDAVARRLTTAALDAVTQLKATTDVLTAAVHEHTEGTP